MKEVERTIHLYRKVDINESMEERHEKVMEDCQNWKHL